ncbi:MAG: RpiB/LacA/LacB family sugar-phosphate isomerase, partial [Lachnospiraceae bacterium]|nr:RpiB/LacA/LacB family sugar-phosphate isomerase [Lachnospiraceae bacterium]
RLHNDANILALGANIIGYGLAEEITDIFLKTEFSGGERHVRRVNAIEKDD